MPTTRDPVQDLINRHVAAWCVKSPEGVAASYTDEAIFSINRADPMVGRQDIADMVKGFCDEFPEVVLTLDHSFVSGDHAVYVWTFTGTHSESGKRVRFQGWEEWELTDEPRVKSSRGWYDAQEYERQMS